MMQKLLRHGSQGKEVEEWQYFLRGQDLYFGKVDGDFGDLTLEATKAFQKESGLDPDGIVGSKTYGAAKKHGFGKAESYDKEFFPPKPNFKPLIGNVAREKIFGKFSYKSTPTDRNPEKITITDNWKDENIVKVYLPELEEATDGKYRSMYFHNKCAYQLRMMFAEWKEQGLIDLILTYAGAFYPRYIRGSRKTLSNHSWGTAFDINVAWNGLGKNPASKGSKGSVMELVEIANKWGFYWGGHFSRKDGMHFEVAKIIPDPNK